MYNLDNSRRQDQRPLTLSNGGLGVILRIDPDHNCLFRAVVEGYKTLIGPAPEYLTHYILLRNKVVEELKNPKFLDILNRILSDEQKTPIENITDEDRENYFKKIVMSGVWGGELELHVIAHILEIRIIIYRNDKIIKIPATAEYDAWPELLHLVNESIDNSSLSEISGEQNNHYNLALPMPIGEEVVRQYHRDKRVIFESQIKKFPRSNSNNEQSDHFRNFFFSLSAYCESIEDGMPDEKLIEKFFYHLEMLWKFLLNEFMDPYSVFSLRKSGVDLMKVRMDTRKMKRLLAETPQDKLSYFFGAYPYVKDLLFIDSFLNTVFNTTDFPLDITVETRIEFDRVVNSYVEPLKYYNKIQPLLVLLEHLKLMLNLPDFNQEFYENNFQGARKILRDRHEDPNIDLVFLSLFVGKYISYDLRMCPGFKKFNWSAIDSLYHALSKDKEVISPDRKRLLTENLKIYVEELIAFQLGEITEDAISTIDVTDIMLINVRENITPAFEIIEDYFGILDQITVDDKTSRLAILRIITAIGEAIHTIELLIPEPYRKLLKIITDIRDHIVHSATLDAFNYVEDLVNNPCNSMLKHCLDDLKNAKEFFIHLKAWLDENKTPDEFPVVPPLENLISLEQEFSKARMKDERDEVMPASQRVALIGSLPADDVLPNPHWEKIQDFAHGRSSLKKNDFKEACSTLTANEATKLHEKIVEIKKINALKKAIFEDDVDFEKINLNTAKNGKSQLQKIKDEKDLQALSEFLEEHEKKFTLNEKDISILDSQKFIDIRPYKALLKELAENGIGKIKKEEFNKAIAIVFKDDIENKNLWEMSYEMLNTKHVRSIKKYQIIQLNHVIKMMGQLRLELRPIFDDKNINSKKNLVVSAACEMIYGFCLDTFKRILKFLESMYDYTDQTLYYYKPDHPIKNVKMLLENALNFRNDMFHFERVFKERIYIAAARYDWFSYIQYLIFGMHFQYALMIFRSGEVLTEPFKDTHAFEELNRLKDAIENDLSGDENRLNIYEANVARILSKSPTQKDESSVANASAAEAVIANSDILARVGVFTPMPNLETRKTELLEILNLCLAADETFKLQQQEDNSWIILKHGETSTVGQLRVDFENNTICFYFNGNYIPLPESEKYLSLFITKHNLSNAILSVVHAENGQGSAAASADIPVGTFEETSLPDVRAQIQPPTMGGP